MASEEKEKNLTLKGLKKETDKWKAEKDEDFEFMNERVTDLDDCMDEVVTTLHKMEEDIKAHADGIKEINDDIGTICIRRPASEEDLKEMQKRMDEVFKKMVRVERAQAKTEDSFLELTQDYVETADKVTYLKEESRRTSNFIGIIAAAGLGLALAAVAVVLGLA